MTIKAFRLENFMAFEDTGWVVLLYQNQRKELSQGYMLTTNNRMELLGSIRGLEALKSPCRVALYTDSQYVVNGMTKGWKKNERIIG